MDGDFGGVTPVATRPVSPDVATQPLPQTPAQPPTTPPVVSGPAKHAHRFIFGYLVLVILVAAVAGVYDWQHRKVNSLSSTISSQNSKIKNLEQSVKPVTNTQVVGTKTYSDSAASASFSYPSNWSMSSIKGLCDEPNGCAPSTDKISAVKINSPDGNISLVWSGISGIGGTCNNNAALSADPNNSACPYETVFNTTPIVGSANLSVVEGVVEYSRADFGLFQPFMSVQDSSGVLKSGQHGLFYDDFKLPSTKNNTLFLMRGFPDGSVSDGYNVTYTSVDKAQSFFGSTDVIQAKEILLSLKVI